jgi:PleD family two-component response regulator
MQNDPTTPSRNWSDFRSWLIKTADEGDHGWMDEQDIKSVLNESCRAGLKPSLLISCRAAVETRPVPPLPVKSAKVRILVIDDERKNCEMLKLGLEKSGFEVRTEEMPKNFRHAIDDFKPDLLLLDMVMPEVDGLDILESLNADDAMRSLPVIVLTGLLADSTAASVNREGLLFLAKPLGTKSLVHCINQHLAVH